MSFVGSYVWKLRQALGSQRILVAGVGLLVMNSEGKVWLGKRSHGGEWCYFGGSVELGDSVPQTACKELLEETGIVTKPEDWIFAGIQTDPAEMNYTYPNGDEVQIINFLFILNYDGPLPLANDGEHTEFGLFDMDDLPQPMKPDAEHSFKYYKVFLQTGQVQVK